MSLRNNRSRMLQTMRPGPVMFVLLAGSLTIGAVPQLRSKPSLEGSRRWQLTTLSVTLSRGGAINRKAAAQRATPLQSTKVVITSEEKLPWNLCLGLSAVQLILYILHVFPANCGSGEECGLAKALCHATKSL